MGAPDGTQLDTGKLKAKPNTPWEKQRTGLVTVTHVLRYGEGDRSLMSDLLEMLGLKEYESVDIEAARRKRDRSARRVRNLTPEALEAKRIRDRDQKRAIRQAQKEGTGARQDA